MFAKHFLLVWILLLIPAAGVPAQEQDLRDRYNTRSLEAAKAIAEAIQLVERKDYKGAKTAIETAVKADGKCQMAHYWKGIILAQLGDVAESIEAYKTALSDEIPRKSSISSSAASNLGILLGKLKEFDESAFWFTRCILEDPANSHKRRGQAYRNLAITLRAQGKPLSAALAVALAFQDKAPEVDARMVRTFFEKADNQEAARVLYFKEKAPQLERRSQRAQLTPAASDQAIAGKVTELLPDPQGRYILALPAHADHYYVIGTAEKPGVRKVTVPRPMLCASLAEGHLYAALENPLQIVKIDAASGKNVQTYTLAGPPPASLVVFPTQGRAFFTVEGLVHDLNLKTGSVAKTDMPGQVVVGHPNQRFLYSFLKPDRRRGGRSPIIINGQPYVIQSRQVDWLQTDLFKAVIVPTGVLLAELRDNAASNATRMSLSPDGNWIAVAGGGGWRPAVQQGASGYGVAVFDAHNLERLQGFFMTDAYPQGVCFNPATAQVAVVRAQDAKVYHLSDPKDPVEVKGKFSGVSAWSGNGRYLVLANEDGGVSLHANSVLPVEQTLAASWWKNIPVTPIVSMAATTASFQPVEALRRFTLTDLPREELARQLAQAAASGRTEKPGAWQDYAPYVKDEELAQTLRAARTQVRKKEDIGITIFQLKKALKSHPDSVPGQFYLAEALEQGDQPDDVERLYLAVVQTDAGRTDLSGQALNHLTALLAAKNRDLAALECLAASLSLDRANPETRALALPLLRKEHFDGVAEQLVKLGAGMRAPASAGLPRLAPPGEGKTYTSAELYQKAVWSVVLIKTGQGSGSGVCVGRPDIIVTNNHVVEGDSPIEVFPFIVKDNAAVRMPALRAEIVLRAPREDLAILRLEKAPAHLQPLAVAMANPRTGEKVYAIGSPGLGTDILEQSVSEGIISATNRILEGQTYLQHSAAVNPGNSGGPLLDDGCRVVGIVTLKTRLENVGFAIPAETVRTVFKGR